MTLAGAGARALLAPSRADLSPGRLGRRQAAWLQFCPQCPAEDEQPYFRREWRLATTIACARHGSRLLDRRPASRTGIGAVQPGVAAALRTIAPPHDFDLASANAPGLGAGARRAAANLADLGRRVTDANSALVDAILALPEKLDPLRAAALTALPCVRSRPRPACAGPRHRSPVRRRDRRGRQPKAACRKHAGGPEGVLACFARGLCGRAPAALRPHLIEIAAVRSSSS